MFDNKVSIDNEKIGSILILNQNIDIVVDHGYYNMTYEQQYCNFDSKNTNCRNEVCLNFFLFFDCKIS